MLAGSVAGVMETEGVCRLPADSAGGKGDETEGCGGTGKFPIPGSEGEDGDGAIPTGRAGVM